MDRLMSPTIKLCEAQRHIHTYGGLSAKGNGR